MIAGAVRAVGLKFLTLRAHTIRLTNGLIRNRRNPVAPERAARCDNKPLVPINRWRAAKNLKGKERKAGVNYRIGLLAAPFLLP